MLRKLGIALVFAVSLSACGHVDEYERHVADMEPVYCYKSLAATACYKEPKHSDSLRLVNYFGPHPSRYDAPEPLPEPNFKAPEMVNYWVKDPEPIPRPMPKGDLADRPWLTADGRAAQQSLEEMTALRSSDVGTHALLRRISLGASAVQDGPDGAGEKATLPSPDLKVE